MNDTAIAEETEIWERVVRETALVELEQYGRLLGIRPLGGTARSFSSVKRLALTFEDQELDVCLKVHRRTSKGFEPECVNWALEEFEVLQAIQRLAGDSARPSVVRPILFLPTLPGILLETNSGEILNDRLRSRRFGRGLVQGSKGLDELAGTFVEVGRNLRALHDLSRAVGSSQLVGSVRPWVLDADYVRAEADKGASIAFGHLRANKDQAHERYRAARDQFDFGQQEFQQVAAHGDFTPINIFVSGQQVTFFDFVNFHLGHPFEDVSRFLSFTFFLQKDPSAYGAADVSRLIAAFMDGYDLDGWRDEPALTFFFQKNIFRTLTGGLRFQGKRWPLSAFYTAGMLRVFRRWVERGMRLPGA